MALEMTPNLNLSSVINILPPELVNSLNLITGALWAFGAFLGIYIIIQIISLFLNMSRNKKLKRIEDKVDLIMGKLNIKSKKK